MGKKKQAPTLDELQIMANDHARATLRNVHFPLPETLTEDEYAAIMNTIVQQLVGAWATGYAAGVDR